MNKQNKTETLSKAPIQRWKMDWKLTGYTVSSLSVLLLGSTAWPGAEHASWRLPVLIAGMTTSIMGMACREYSHWQDKEAIAYAQRKADERSE